MSGTYTNTRVQPLGAPQVCLVSNYGDWIPYHPLDGSRVGSRRQETTSFRSRARKGDIETADIPLIKEEYNILSKSLSDNGHSFYTEKWTTRWGSVNGNRIKQWNSYDFSHPFLDLGFSHKGKSMYVTDKPQRNVFITSNDVASGKAAIAACAPTKPKASLATFAGELLAGLPTLSGIALLKERTSSARALGSEYLNVQFGWLPLVADMTKMVKALSKASATLDQFARDSGRNVRRKHSLPTLTYSQQYTGDDLMIPNRVSVLAISEEGSASGGASASVIADSCVVTVTATQRRWFSGMFTYYVPPEDDFLSKVSRYQALANKLLGTRLTPAVLWELAPWSWLVDWFYDVQSHLEIASLFSGDDLVLRYGYLMVEDRLAIVATGDVNHRPVEGGEVLRDTLYFQNVFETKRRVKSTPFGFGFNPEQDFSLGQWAILGALGLTKAPRTLR